MKKAIVLIVLLFLVFLGVSKGDDNEAFKNAYYKAALHELKPLAEKGYAEAQYNLGVMYEFGQGVPQDFAEAVKWYRKSADQGYTKALVSLGDKYENGQGVPQDYAESLKLYRKAADQGYSLAQIKLGNKYGLGQGVPEDFAEAAKWYRKAADQGRDQAEFMLGSHYETGLGVPQDFAEAVKWYRKAADQGHSRALLSLGNMYFHGQGVPQDYAEALILYKKAADQGDPMSQCMLGAMYLLGKGVSQDYAEALKWSRKAADQGIATAQFNLGRMYDKGLGVSKDDTEALKWYQMAADQGDASAQGSLGAMYYSGERVPRNYILSYMWLNLAASQKSENAIKLRNLLEHQMTPSQIAEAQELSSKWTKKQSGKSKDGSIVPNEVAPNEMTPGIITRYGTGFSVSPNGFIVTANHVIANAVSIKALQGSTILKALLVKSDPLNDVAILKIDKTTPAFLPIALIRSAKTGERVFTIGYPMSNLLGQEQKYTEGVISSLSGIQGAASFMQITVPVQPGNSGGPLVNEKGQVVGVISSTAAVLPFIKASGTIPQNINWAVKADYIRPLLNLTETPQKSQVMREEAIEKTKCATYMIEVETR